MARRTNPTLVGAFVLAAFVLVIAALLLLGGGNWFVQKRRYVVYFDNAIKGLTVGAAVTFKGVAVGRVSSLQVHYIKDTGNTELPVLIDLDPAKFVTLDDDKGGQSGLLQEMIERGLRAQMSPESLITNQQVIQLDFFPDTKVRLIETKLPYPQIPSVPSAFDQLQASVGLAAQNLPELTLAATAAFNQLSGMLTPTNQQKVAQILDNIEQLTGKLAAHGDDIGKTLAALQQASDQLNGVLKGLDQVLADNRQPMGEAVVKIGETAASAHRLADDLSAILEENRPGVKDFANGSLYDLGGLITDSRVLVRRATDTLDQLNRDPSRYLFGNSNQGIPVK